MPVNRRNFLRSASLLATLSLTELQTMAGTGGFFREGPPADEADEDYWQQIRLLFPLTTEWTYLNNGTLGPSPYPVIEAVRNAMFSCDRTGTHGSWEETATRLARFAGAGDAEVALTHNVTEGINIACWGLPLKRGDEVILTTHEHVGNALPWLNRQKLHGIIVKSFTPAPTAAETLNRIAATITKKTRAIAVPHIPCTQGQVLPLKEICRLARDKGIYSAIDGSDGS